MKYINWEETLNNVLAKLHLFKTFKQASSPLKDLAIQKMTDVSVISAEFNGEPRVFEAKLWVLLDYFDSKLEFYGIYIPVDDIEDVDDIVPTVCLRKGFWDRKDDKKQVNKNQDYDKYVLSSKHVNARTIFTFQSRVENIMNLIFDIKKHLFNQILIKDNNQEDNLYYIRLQLYDGALFFDIGYCPLSRKEQALEKKIIQLKELFLKLNFDEGVAVDEGTYRISYSESMLERLAGYIDDNETL